MNIPDDAFYGLVTQGMRQRTDETLQRALYHTLRHAILQGTLAASCRLPGSRVIAGRLHLSRNTVNAALEQLTLEGYLTRSRQGTQVVPLAASGRQEVIAPPVVLSERLQGLPAAMRRDSPALPFTPGMPAVNYFPLPLWRRLIDKALRDEGSTLLGYGEAAGDPQLREAIARHLALSRGIRCDIRQIVITEGALEGVNLCASLLTNPGDSVWLEEPGYLGARSGFQRAGLRVCGMAVDGEGMCIANGVAEPPRLIFTSPSHQYPLGSVMSAARRLALVEYAHRHGAWIVEDDYDSEFRHSGEPIPAMLGMVPDAPVVYLGTFSKTLFPALRIGFMVMPSALADAAQEAIGALLRGGHRAGQLYREGTLCASSGSDASSVPQTSATAARGAGARDYRAVRSPRWGRGTPSDVGHRGDRRSNDCAAGASVSTGARCAKSFLSRPAAGAERAGAGVWQYFGFPLSAGAADAESSYCAVPARVSVKTS